MLFEQNFEVWLALIPEILFYVDRTKSNR